MRETSVERHLGERAKKAGGKSIKVMPVVAGTPDRLVMLPPGRLFWVETKAPGGRLRPVQKVFRRRAAKMGVPVAVLSSSAEVDAWMDERIREVAPCSRTGYDGAGKPPSTESQQREGTMHITIDTREPLSAADKAALRALLGDDAPAQTAPAALTGTVVDADEPDQDDAPDSGAATAGRVSPYGFADPDREPGKPRAGNKRRSAAEKAEDDAYFAAQESEDEDEVDLDDADDEDEVDLDDEDDEDEEALLAEAQQRAQEILADGDRDTVAAALKKVKAKRISLVTPENAQKFLDALNG